MGDRFHTINTECAMTENNSLHQSSDKGEFFEILDYEYNRALRYKNAVTLMFIKLCHLDEVASNYGQLTATSVCAEIKKLISNNIRQADRGFIYDKDEFMLILPNTPKDSAQSMVPKLQGLIENYLHAGEKKVTLSVMPKFGISTFPHDATILGAVDKPSEVTSTENRHIVGVSP